MSRLTSHTQHHNAVPLPISAEQPLYGRKPTSLFMQACLRLAIYAPLVAAMMSLVMHDAHHFGDVGFSEASWTEHMQSTLLALSAATMWLVHSRLPDLRTISLLLFGLFAASLIREQDALLDGMIGDGSWQFLVSVVAIPVIIGVWRNRNRFIAEFEHFGRSFAFGLFGAGFLATYVFSRLYGRSEFWETLMGDSYLRSVKNAAEEVTELFGYTLMAIAVIEIVLLAIRMGRQRRALLRELNAND
ncbi:hypothetical protein U0O11_15170 [Cobetia sp. D5]|uniref:hypothetical protein n=1 Tax=unclassified Cobetia TaxID=2609414 RepID=UPI00244BFE7E|nr:MULTISPECIES: hypothetical protein [unclassified Cobetia]MDH2299526.1 hypothetical protein [Cobetia sp. 29-18-1]